MKKFDPAIPRQMFWSDSVRDRTLCPKCHSKLENESHVYLMAVRDGHDIQPLIVGNDGGYFCPNCSTVVLDKETFRSSGILGCGNHPRAQFTVLGIVDLAAVPEEKRSRPLGEDGNPIPLVKFLTKPATGRNRQRKAKAKKKKKLHGRKRKSG